jgi:hypothetical protein
MILLTPLGCGPGIPQAYPVTGRVAYKGREVSIKPLAGGRVRFESVADAKVFAQGEIEEDGTFSLNTRQESRSFGGLVPGEYRARVEPPGFSDELTEEGRVKRLRAVINPRYLNYNTSGLRYTIEPRENEIKIEVEK